MYDELAPRFNREDATDYDVDAEPLYGPQEVALQLHDKLIARGFWRFPIPLESLGGPDHLVALWVRDRPIDDPEVTGSWSQTWRTGVHDSVALWSGGTMPSRIAGTATIFGWHKTLLEDFLFCDALCAYIDVCDERLPPLGRVETWRRKRRAEQKTRERQQQGYAF